MTGSVNPGRGSLPTREARVSSPEEEHPGLAASKHRAERETPPPNEVDVRWAGVFIAAVGAALIALSLALEGGLF